ncbi:recombinase RecO [Spirochaetia bacterium]|nr:recombinase RecO [Spirochaetia bacterium]
MSRTFSYSGIALRVRSSGESNRQAWFLTPEAGVIEAVVFGGPKSHLRASVSQFHQGKLLLYHDPVKDSWKVTDFDVQSWRPGIREHYSRLCGAGAIAETLLASYGSGGNWEDSYARTGMTLDALSDATGRNCRGIVLHFLWKWIDLLGQKPALDRCDSCERPVPVPETMHYVPADGVLICTECIEHRNDWNIAVGPGARRWLNTIEHLSPDLLFRYTADTISLSQVKTLVTELLAGIIGKRLRTWDEV